MSGRRWHWAQTELAEWSARRDMPTSEIAPRIGKSKTSVFWKLKRMPVSNSHINRPKLSHATLAEMRRLWEECPELSAHAIGVLLDVTKNTVIGQAHRRRWKMRGESRPAPKTTTEGRIIALHAALDRVLAATTGIGRVPNVPKMGKAA